MPDIYEIVNATQLDSDLEDIADAIRAKSQGQDPLQFPNEFISEIGSIPTGASITGATDVTVEALQPIAKDETCYIFTRKYSKYLRPTPMYTVAMAGVAWSPDGSRVACTFSGSPRIAIYDTTPSDGWFARITAPSTYPTGDAKKMAWSPDGTRLAVAHTTSPYITIYDTTTTPYTKISDPATLPAGNATCCAWSPDGTRLAVAHATTPFITIYDTTTTPYTKIADPATLPAGTCHQCAFSHNGAYLAVSHSSSPRITIYDTSTTPYTKLTNPSILPGGTQGSAVAWSPDDTRLAVGGSSSDYLTIYNTTTSPFSKIASTPQPNGTALGIDFSPDGTRLAVASSQSPYFATYDTTTTPYTKETTPSTIPDATGYDCKYSPNGRFIAMATGAISTPASFASNFFIYVIVGANPVAVPGDNYAVARDQDLNYGYAKAAISKGATGPAVSLFRV